VADSFPSDEALMLRYRDGDAAAFEDLYKRHKGGIYRFVLRSCGRPGLAEELFQEVWVSLIRSRASYAATAKFTTYLYHIARNRLIDHYRAHDKELQETALLDDNFDLEAAVGASADGPEQIVATRQQARRIIDVLAKLPAAQREAYLLFEEGGLNVEQIALTTGVNRETAKSRLRYAFNKLKQVFAE
jgi:RNA polymerase sigma-70 factor, ECF subfamily